MKSTTNIIATITLSVLFFAIFCACATSIRELEGNFFYTITFGDSKCSPSTIQSVSGLSIVKPANPSYPLSGSCFEKAPDQYGYSQYQCDASTANVKNLCRPGCVECFEYETHPLHQCNDRSVSGCGKLPDFILYSDHFNVSMLWNLQYQVHSNEKENQCGRTSNDFLVSFFASRINTCLTWFDSTEVIKCNSTDYSFLKYKPATDNAPQCTRFESAYNGKVNTCSGGNNNVNICK
ncbi:hypothetical protein NAEGRDRAFT_79186 [Naegleria gruberi]|uniref:Uncharacterized protein n=1 Tax=Naegleria gruberi TaxID=5762 RepID=D2VA85_NAEGR|nr:uncharacterized protein NAEGRDRAFT_79186 [Naegleria gruberi]EFC46385.1 hypothetical protein NAEGRDRAFT_79186 [Naegleria gruberi]|eukprot:XP_002679129.1 hypothetical protein NAEGRDRAFT_79186 [Naegleria gruberi strain NEG-M]